MVRFIDKHFKVEDSNSLEQFIKDFGEYPPAPMKCASPETSFKIFYLSKIGRIVYTFNMLRRLSKSKDSERSEIFSEKSLGAEWVIMYKTFNESVEGLDSFKKLYGQLGVVKRVIFSILLITALPILAAFFLCLSPRFFIAYKNMTDVHDFSAGGFLPVLNDDLEITVNTSVRNREDSIISHEHIHLCQYISYLKNNPDGSWGEGVNSPEDFIDATSIEGGSNILYYYERREIEARLHELVLSFYRSSGFLPVSKDGFLEMLVSSSEYSMLAKAVLRSSSIDVGISKSSSAVFSARDVGPVNDLIHVTLKLKNKDLAIKFILEVLPVMYINLLGYYGVSDIDPVFKSQIERPNLYDRMYG